MNTMMRVSAAAALLLLVRMPVATAQEAGSQKQPGSQKQQPAHREAEAREAGEENEHTVAESSVPAQVLQGFRRAYPHARASKWSTEMHNGRTAYEVESVEGSTHRDLLISIEGDVLETETRLTPAQLPAPVRTAAQAHGAHIERAELVVAGRDTTYEIKVRGREGEMKLRANGQPVPATRQ